MIAADINNDENISVSDLLQLRKLILGITSEFPSNESYRMISSEQVFDDILNPWPLQESINLDALLDNMEDQDFVSIKIGDVNNNATYGLFGNSISTIRSGEKLNLMYENKDMKINEKYSINISTQKEIALYGMQISFSVEGLTIDRLVSHHINISEIDYTV